ncbi:Bifunctional hemolysin/adenylate cyclase precursor [Stieleria maiorica]|uniref:Probable pectate lyase C n=1 Tax=Stieleria maiorica TaxID=2795974 RepID=A0A5B9MKU7_9BACT|nr:right-handed parallel beta-helix repeat-containing protein [Stieleria maiorica]QEG01889.1 Bifunctional hemolysin/adenylate cyclase precursor [Stieleria maiorica]
MPQPSQQRLVDGLENLSQWSESLRSFGELDLPISVIRPDAVQASVTVGDHLPIGSILESRLVDPVSSYFASLAGGVGDSTALAALLNATDLSTSNQLLFEVDINEIRTATQQIDLSRLQDESVLRIDASQEVTVSVESGVDLRLRFGLDLDPEIDSIDSFFIEPTEMVFSSSVNAGDLILDADVGFLSMNTSSGAMDVDVQVKAELSDPDQGSSPRITSAQLRGMTLSEFVTTTTLASTFEARLPLVSEFASDATNRFDIGKPLVVTVSDDVYEGVDPTITYAGDGLEEFRSFRRIDAGQTVSLFKELSRWFDAFAETSALQVQLPLVQNTTFGDLVDFGDLVTTQLVSPLVDDSDAPTFATVQELAEQLVVATGRPIAEIDPRYDTASNRLSFHLPLNGVQFDASAAAAVFDVDLAPLTLLNQTNSISLVASNNELRFDVEIDLSPFQATFRGEVDLPADGQLSSDASFALAINEQSPVSVLVSRDTNNTGPADLVDDFLTALSAAGLSDVQVTLDQGRLRMTAPESDSVGALIVIADPLDTAVTELGLARPVESTVASVSGVQSLNASGQLTGDAHFNLSVHGEPTVAVTVNSASTADNQSTDMLLDDIRDALTASGLGNVGVDRIEDALTFFTTDDVETPSLVLTSTVGDPAVLELGLAVELASLGPIALGGGVDALDGRVLLDNLVVDVGVSGTSNVFAADARYGFVDVGISNGSVSNTYSLLIASPANQPLPLDDLLAEWNKPDTTFQIERTGNAFVSLPITPAGNLLTLTGSPQLDVSIDDLFGNRVIALSGQDLGALEPLLTLDFADVVAGFTDIGRVLGVFLSAQAVNQPLLYSPQTTAKAVELVSDYEGKSATFSQAQVASLQQLESAIESAFELADSQVTLQVATDGSLNVGLDWELNPKQQLTSIDIDLTALSNATVGGIPEWSRSRSLYESNRRSVQTVGGGDVHLDFGFQLTPGLEPVLYVSDTSNVDLAVQIDQNNFNTTVNSGPLSMAVSGGSIVLDDGNGAPARYQLSLPVIAGGRYVASAINDGGAVQATVQGRSTLTLPLTHPTTSVALSPALRIDVPDLSAMDFSVATPDLADIVDQFDAFADQRAMPGFVRRVFDLLQTTFNASVGDVNQPIIGQSLSDSTFLSDLGNEIATALESEFAAGRTSFTDVQAVFQTFNLGPPPAPVPPPVAAPPEDILWTGQITSGLPGITRIQPLASGIPGLSTDVDAILVGDGTVAMNFGYDFVLNEPVIGLEELDELNLSLVGAVPQFNQLEPVRGNQGSIETYVRDDSLILTHARTFAEGDRHSYSVDLNVGDPIQVVVMPSATLRPRVKVTKPGGGSVVLDVSTPFLDTFSSSPNPGDPVIFAGRDAIASVAGTYVIEIDDFTNSSGSYAAWFGGTRIQEKIVFDLGKGDDIIYESELDKGLTVDDIKADPQRAPVKRSQVKGDAFFDVVVEGDSQDGFNYLSLDDLAIETDTPGPVSRTLDLVERAGYTPATLDSGTLRVIFDGSVRTTEQPTFNTGVLRVRFLDAANQPVGSGQSLNIVGQQFSIVGVPAWDSAGVQLRGLVDVPAGARKLVYELSVDNGFQGDVLLSDAKLVVRHNEPLMRFGIETQWPIDFDVPRAFTPKELADSISLAQQSVEFVGLELNVGEAIRQFAKPVIDELKAQTTLLRDPVESLRKPVVSSDAHWTLRRVFGSTTILDMVESVTGDIESFEDMDQFFKVIDIIADMNPSQPGAGFIDIGGFQLLMNDYDPLQPESPTNRRDWIDVVLYDDNNPNVITDFDTQSGEYAFKINELKVNGGGDLQIDLLRNARGFSDLLIGRPVTIVDFQMPELNLRHTINRGFGVTIWDFLPGFSNRLSGEVRVRANIHLGYDNIDGPFVYANDSLIELGGEITVDLATFEISLPYLEAVKKVTEKCNKVIAGICDSVAKVVEWVDEQRIAVGRAGLRGGIDVNVTLKPKDADGDGKIRATEWEQTAQYRDNIDQLTATGSDGALDASAILTQVGMHCKFDFYGQIDGVIEAFYRAGKAGSDEKNLARINLYHSNSAHNFVANLTNDTNRLIDLINANQSGDDLAHVALADCGVNPPTLATLVPGSGPDELTLLLNMGPRAGFRQTVNTTDGNETFSVENTGTPGVVRVTFGPFVQVYGQPGKTITKVVADGGQGDDTIVAADDFNIAVDFYGGAGNDFLVGGMLNDAINGGSGRDTLVGGLGADQMDGGGDPDEVRGGEGADTLYGGTGWDSLYGGSGNDRIDGDSGNDLLVGGTGTDVLQGGSGSDLLYGHLDPASPGTSDDSAPDSLHGGTGNDFLDGGFGNDFLSGDEGHDQLFGNRGNDGLSGGTGDDTLDGGDGVDLLEGDSGADLLRGGDDDDVLYGNNRTNSPGDLSGDVLYGQRGDDELHGQDGDDFLDGGDDADTLHGGDGTDRLFGRDGQDVLYGDAGNDAVDGGNQDDVLYGGPGMDTLSGGFGEDTLRGESGNDELYGGPDNDTIEGGSGSDLVDGQSGNDTIYGHTIDGTGDDNLRDRLNGSFGADTIYGGGGPDIIRGGGDNDFLYGQNGDDEIFGEQGIDRIEGGTGSDTLDGGSQNDFVYGHSASGAGDDLASDSLLGGYGDDLLIGNGGPDHIRGGPDKDLIYGHSNSGTADDEAADSLYGDDHEDTILGQGGPDTIFGGHGNDSLIGGAGADVINGDDGHDALFGGEDADSIDGGDGNDEIEGGEGADTIFGGAGDDRVQGGLAADSIQGGTGRDELRGGEGDDVIAGGEDDDRIFGEQGNDHLLGDDGNDTIEGGSGVDTLQGGSGDDRLIAGSGIGNVIRGDAGDDFITGSDEGGESDPDFSDATYFGDFIDGGSGADTIDALGGADHVLGGVGNDTIRSGAGGDFVQGGWGDDLIDLGSGTHDVGHGDEGNDVLYGSVFGDDILIGHSGDDKLFGRGGNDGLYGGDGDDLLDGGTGTDVISGDAGDDELIGGGGVGDQLSGGAGNDVIRGSDDGADIADGGPGKDVIYGFGGNDSLAGGDDDDVIHGGSGDDLIEGGQGSDTLLGEADHDVIYGHTAVGSDDDDAVDYLYGDFGIGSVGTTVLVTMGNPGRDQLFGGGGNDLLFGEGDDDAINPGAGASDVVDFGSGESAVPNDFIPPSPTPAPAVQSQDLPQSQASTLPTGDDEAGRWHGVGGSNGSDGISGRVALATEPSIAIVGDARYVAWADDRSGTYQIYVARHDSASGWTELDRSAGYGGISNSGSSSRAPSITVDASGRPVVAWTERSGTQSNIHVAVWNPVDGHWQSLAGAGQSSRASESGRASQPQIVSTTAGIVVFWIDELTGTRDLAAFRFDGVANQWVGLDGSSNGFGVCLTQNVLDYSVDVDGSKIAIGFTKTDGTVSNVHVKEFGGVSWTDLSASPVTGISDAAESASEVSVAYHQGELFAAWTDSLSSDSFGSEVYVLRRTGTTWTDAGTGSAAERGVSGPIRQSTGRVHDPVLSSNAGRLYLSWIDHRDAIDPGKVFSLQWSGLQFQAAIGGDASGAGIVRGQDDIDTIVSSVDSSGRLWLTWARQHDGVGAIGLVGQGTSATNVFLADSTNTVANILATTDLNPGDRIVIVGDQPVGFTVLAADSGVQILGAPGVSIHGPVAVDGATGVLLQNLQLESSLSILDASNFTMRDSSLLVGGVFVSGGNNLSFIRNDFGFPVTLAGAGNGILLSQNRFQSGLELTGNAVDVAINDNIVASDGIDVFGVTSGVMRANSVVGTLDLQAEWTGAIEDNRFHGSPVGVRYAAPAQLRDNRIDGNQTGVVVDWNDPASGFGQVGVHATNQIEGNGTGVLLNTTNATVSGQEIHNNGVGISGVGRAGGFDPLRPNRLVGNTTGIATTGPIEFNTIIGGSVGISAASTQTISHNVFQNSATSIDVSGTTSTRIQSNTFVDTSGTHVHLHNQAMETEIRGNLMSTSGGTNIVVEPDSEPGFFSDHNLLHAEDGGHLVRYSVTDFDDILDWQRDLHKFDLNSFGTTVVSPTGIEPVYSLGTSPPDRLIRAAANQRRTGPGTDGGSSLTPVATSVAANTIANPVFSGGMTGWTASPTLSRSLSTEAFYQGNQSLRIATSISGTLSQVVGLNSVGVDLTKVDAGRMDAVASLRVRVEGGGPPKSTLRLELEFRSASDSVLKTVQVDADASDDRWSLVGDRVAIPPLTRSVAYRVVSDGAAPVGTQELIDDASLIFVDDAFAADLGAGGGSESDAGQIAGPRLYLRRPDLYLDWERDVPKTIHWDSHDVPANEPIRIELWQDTSDGPAFLTTITTATANDGQYTWTPVSSGIDFGTHGLRLQLSLANDRIVFDRSFESFSVPEQSSQYFVNDVLSGADEYTTAAGSHRNTGRLPTSPKPSIDSVLQAYMLSAGDTLYADNGDYRLFYPITISNVPGIGDDEGFVMRGALNGTTTLRHAGPLTVAPLVELLDADFVTVSDFRLNDAQYGLYASDGTTSLTAERLEVSGHDVDGISLGSGHAQRLTEITAADNGRFGIYSQGSVGELVAADVSDNASGGVRITGNVGLINQSAFYNNGGSGLYLDQAGSVTITSSTASRNDGHGLFAYGLVDGAVIGTSDLSLAAGNQFYENAGDGVYASGLALIAGNVAYGNASGAGVRNRSGGTVQNNVSFGNLVGIDSYGPVIGNRVYDNRDGVRGYYDESIRDNVVYSNDYGILAFNSSEDVNNNLVYDIAEIAVSLNQPQETTRIRNNTIVVGGHAAALRIVDGHGPSVTNNILVVDGGSVFDLNAPSQLTHRSDYNLYHVTGTGNLGVWAGVARSTLSAWQLASGADASSLVGDPHFVDVAGADGIVGASGTARGFDDDFHLQSQFGSLHGQSFAPVIDPANGLPVLAIGTWMLDARQSIGIDRGDESIPVGDEPSDNGGYINLGAYGGTTAASKSPSQFMLVTKPSAAANWPAGQSFPIHWRTSETGGTVDIQLVPDGGGTPILIADDTTNDGQFTFTVDTSVPPGAYIVSVETAAGLAGMTPFPIHVTGQINAYYVNIPGDADLTDNQYTTAAGDPSFSGTSPDAPKSSIREILFAYDLEPGDIIFVDTGLYTVEANIVIDAEDSGVRIVGPTEVGKAAILDRGNTNAGSYVFDLVGTDSVTLSNLSISGADSGIHLGTSAGNTNTTIVGNDLFGNQTHGVVVFGGNTDTLIEGNSVHDNVYYGLRIDGDRTTVSGNRVYANQSGVSAGYTGQQTQRTIIDNVVHSNTSQGIYLYGFNTEAIDNEVYGHSSGVGIQMEPGSVARGNVVHGNDVGIGTQYGATVDSNRVYDNRIGIRTTSGYDTVLVGNRVYSNSEGIRIDGQNYVTISNNLVYANTNSAVYLKGGYRSGEAHPRITGNTIYQSVGDAVTIEQSSEVRLSNNILWVENGAAISVAADAQVGFASDYNLFHLAGAGILSRWDGQGIDGLASWRFELGFDFDGLSGDPMFLDVDGDDGLVGFDRDVLSTMIIDDGDAGFSTTGTWTTYTTGGGNPGGFDDDYRQGDFGDNGTATWTFSGLTAGTTYRLAATWRGDYYADAQYRVSSGGREIGVVNKRQYEFGGDAADDFIADGHGWEWFGHYVASGDTIQVTLIDTGGFRYSYADAMRLDAIAGDRGIDDDFHLRSGSPAIDRGDPLSPYFLEPLPSGDRINLGAYGNTSEATPSDSQTVQVTSPVGLEKWTAGDTETIEFRSSGLTAMRTALALNAGGTAVGGWSGNAFQGNSHRANVAQPVDLTAVPNPAPAEIYQSYAYSANSVEPLRYELPLRSGSYTVRLHFVSTPYTTFDLSLQGQVVESSVDLNAQAGGTERGLVKEFAVTVVGDEGLVIEMASVNGWFAEGLAGIEVLQPNTNGSANPTAAIDVSTDGGASWAEIATGIALDTRGVGRYDWTILSGFITTGSTALVRVRSGGVSGRSASAFMITPAGNQFYVNVAGDADLTDNQYTTAAGDNAANGRSPSTPMASIAALLRAYDLNPGDTIYVDTGTYDLLANIVIDAEDSGVRIVGPTEVGKAAILDRGNTNAGSYVFDLVGTDSVTLSNLSISGADSGIHLGTSAGNTNTTIVGNDLFGNQTHGVVVFGGNTDTLIEGNSVHDNVYYGLRIDGDRTTVSGNRVYANQSGVSAGYTGQQTQRTIIDNVVHSNTSQGIYLYGFNTEAIDNEVYGHSSGVGIQMEPGSVARGNVVHGNDVGIGTQYGATVDSNWVYDNRIGIRTTSGYDTVLVGNRVYSNSEGIRIDGQNYVTISNNLVYANTNSAVYLKGGYRSGEAHPRITGNTIYQSVGDAVTIEQSSDVRLSNNILWVENGAAISVAADAQFGFASDYNLVHLGTGSSVSYGIFAGQIQSDLAAWQAATGDAARSIAADPLFLDVNGIDNRLGYVDGQDHSRDDNWTLGKASPAIDSGFSWVAFASDAIGSPRRDDVATPDSGSLDYFQTPISDTPFVSSGTAMNWKAGYPDYASQYVLPFAFPFFGQVYGTVTITTGGLIQFENTGSIHWDETAADRFSDAPQIAALWDNLRTNETDDDIFIDESTADQVTIRWDATHVDDGRDVDFAVTLYADGEFRFSYGSDVSGSPVAGYADPRSARTHFVLPPLTQSPAANQAIDFELRPGQVDRGALEFRGSSDDNLAPLVTSTLPGAIGQQQPISALIDSVRIQFSEEVNYFDAGSFAAYELREAGANGTFGDGDDVVYQLVPQFSLGNSFVDLQILFAQAQQSLLSQSPIADGPISQSLAPSLLEGFLPEGTYRFSVQSDQTGGVRDTAGLLIDGDGDANPGGNYVREFEVFFLPEFTSLSLSANANEGGTATLSGEIIDHSAATSHSVQVDWGDGTAIATYAISAGQTSFQIHRTYAQDSVPAAGGQFVVTATLVNNLGRSSGASGPMGVAVHNVAPVLTSLTAPTDVTEGQEFTLTGQFSDPGTADTHVLSVDWGDGSPTQQVTLAVGSREFSVPHIYLNVPSRLTPIDRTINITLGDDGSTTVSANRGIRLTPINAPPSIDDAVMVVNEMADDGQIVGQLINADPDLIAPNEDTQSFAIVGGSGLGRFAIDNSGIITVVNGAALDFESVNSYSLVIEVTDGHGLKDQATITINLANVPEVESIQIGDGTRQRSVIRRITVRFDTLVTFDPGAFEIQKIGGGSIQPDVATEVVNGKTVATLTFQGQSTIGGSLADGNYRLRIVHDRVVAGELKMRTDAVDDFFRFFGDTDGDRDVDGQDYGRLGLTFLKSSPNPAFNPALDFDGDGDVDGQDYANFGVRFLRRLPE